MIHLKDDDKNKVSKTSNMGLAITMGAGVGLIFGELVFDNVGVGLVIGAGIGIAFSRVNKVK